jgi:uncharacterized protein DUF1016
MNSLLHLYEDISKILLEARKKVYTSINSEMVIAYWRIGKRIIEEEQLGGKRAEYGTFLISQISERLSKEFGKGFSVANVKNFRQFYLIFPENAANQNWGKFFRSNKIWPKLLLRISSNKKVQENKNPIL